MAADMGIFALTYDVLSDRLGMEERVRMEAGDDWRLTEKVHAGSGKGNPFSAAVRATRMPMIITDPRQHDNPIVFANDAFLKLTGYSRLEVTGRNCRFLQGPATDPESVAKIRAAIQARTDVSVDLVNYRKDGTTFYNALYISPVYDDAGELQFFFASQLDVSDRYGHLEERERAYTALLAQLEAKGVLVREIDHRVKNNLQMVSAMIRLQSRNLADASLRRSFISTAERIEALSTVHRHLYDAVEGQRVDMRALIGDLAEDLIAATGRADIALDLRLDPIFVKADRSAALALLLNETLTNALKHAFPDGRAGRLSVHSQRDDDGVALSVVDDGIGKAPDKASGKAPASDSFGMELIETLTRQLGGTRSTSASAGSGMRVDFSFPGDNFVAG